MNSSISLVIVTISAVFHWVLRSRNHLCKEYQNHSATIFMAAEDLRDLQLRDGETVKIASEKGVIVVRAEKLEGISPGSGFMPVSPYSNKLFGYNSDKNLRLFNLKHVRATCRATDEEIQPLGDLYEEICEGKFWLKKTA